ncbi:hypothetical protein TNCV_2344861 [Trichonephila clavipes]|nr:hypothetical protein TNCV_2344861 [Trichonephila clavipes]
MNGFQGGVFQQDNALLHTAVVKQRALQSVDMLPWPVKSPYLSPIEHIWDITASTDCPRKDTTSTASMELHTTKGHSSPFGLAVHQNDHQARRRFVEWAQNEIAAVPDFHKRILFSDETHFWLNGYVNKQNCRIWSEANPQVYVETPLHPEKLTVWCALWAGGILLQKR